MLTEGGKPEVIPSFSTFNGKNIYPEFEKDPDIALTKADLKKLCNETKEIAEKWFEGKDDNWLIDLLFNKLINFDNTMCQLIHIMCYVGHCEAIFRENGVKTGEYLDYWG